MADTITYHGSPVAGLTELLPKPSHALGGESAVFTTPDKDLAATFGARWTDDDLQQGYINGKPYFKERKPGALERIYKGQKGYIYSTTNEGRSDPRLMKLERIHSTAIPVQQVQVIEDLLEAIRSSGFKITPYKKQADHDTPVSFVPRNALPLVSRHGLLGGKALIDNPEALSAAAQGRNTTPEEFKASVEKILSSWKKYQAMGPNVMFKAPPSSIQLSDNHPMRQSDLVPIGVDLASLLREQPKTRVYGMELTPYDETKHINPRDRHRYLNKRKTLPGYMNMPAEDLWKHYADPENKGFYAPDVPHAAIHTEDATIAPKYLNIPKQAEVQGIPDRKDYGDYSKLPVNQLIDYVVQKHKADRAGLHTDLRFGNKDTGLLSWAVRKGMPQVGQKHLAVQQPVHDHAYKDFQGKIESGYGKGEVTTDDKGEVLVTRSSPNALHFTVAHKGTPERFVLVKTNQGKDGRGWLLMNLTPTAMLPEGKRRYVPVSPERAEEIITNLPEGASVQPKIDGASLIMPILKDKIEAISYRQSKKTGGPISYTEKLFKGIPSPYETNMPMSLRGTLLRGELYGVDKDNKPIPAQQLGGLLNSSISKSIKDQESRGVNLKALLYDIDRRGKQKTDNVSYQDRYKMLQEITQYLPKDKVELPEQATTPEAAMDLWTRIKNRQHNMTSEGVIVHPSIGVPMKAKIRPEFDVWIKSMFPGRGKYKGTGVGGFEYSHEQEGPTVGRVGTGLSDELRRSMYSNPNDYVGRVAKVHAHAKLPSGALREPSLHSLHEDYPQAPISTKGI